MAKPVISQEVVPDPAQLTLNGHGTQPSTDPGQESWDIDSLRLSQDFAAELGGQKVLTVVPVRKPARQEFFRVHPSEQWRLLTALLTVEEERGESYLVAPNLREVLANEIRPVMLFTCLSRQDVVFLWPARMPTADRRAGSWHSSALDAAQRAMHHWIRLAANQNLGAYEVFKATGYTAEPAWPDVTFDELVKLAFKGKYIASPDHPVLQRLRGDI